MVSSVNSVFQSTFSTCNCLTTNLAARCPETTAKVTPEEKIGAKNSVAFLVNTKPTPWNLLVVTDQPSMVFGSKLNSLSLKR